MLALAGCGGSGGHSADWNYGYKYGQQIFSVGIGNADLRCSNLINGVASVNAFHGDVNDAIAGCEAAGAQVSS